MLQIKSGLYEREGKGLTNFQRVLPRPDSDLAEQILKDPYNFDFLPVTGAAKEREIERGLLLHLRDLLLELGREQAKELLAVSNRTTLKGERDYVISSTHRSRENLPLYSAWTKRAVQVGAKNSASSFTVSPKAGVATDGRDRWCGLRRWRGAQFPSLGRCVSAMLGS